MARGMLFFALILVLFSFVMAIGGFGGANMVLYFLIGGVLLSILAQLIPFPP